MNGSINTIEEDTDPILYSPSTDQRQRSSPRGNSNRRASELGRNLRQPVQYNSVNSIHTSTGSYSSHDSNTAAVLSRYKYYNKLAPHSDSTFAMPDHVVPSVFLLSNILPSPGSQPSWVTIFSLWNTMMGTSLLSMPWAINQAGFVTGIALLLAMAGLMLYTSYRILKSVEGISISSEVLEFSDVCRYYLGRWAEVIAFISSLLTLLGGMIVYWILISNFLYNIVAYIYHQASGEEVSSADSNDPICPNSKNHTPDTPMTNHTHDATFQTYWDEQKTVPLILIAVLFPLINFKSPTFFTKFNALGTVSVTYLVCFAMKNAISWGIHLDFHDTSSPIYVHEFKLTFPALTGISALAYFVQNCVLSVTRTQKNPENNVRDLIIAYILVAVTYIYMGVIFYISFGLDKGCIEDNFLNNLKDTNVMAFVARIGLFFQMLCVFPLLVYILRLQFMNSIFGTTWPSLKHVVILNLVLVAVCVVFGVFLPHIGKIIGFVGSLCGFSYAIALPCLVFMKIRYNQGTLTKPIIIIHVIFIVYGFANFVAQFLLLGHTS